MWTSSLDLFELIVDLHLDDQSQRPLFATYHDNGSVISLESAGSEARRILESSSLYSKLWLDFGRRKMSLGVLSRVATHQYKVGISSP